MIIFRNGFRVRPSNGGDAGEVWVATARDVPETEAYYDQMDYDYMDAENSGPTVTPKRIKRDHMDEAMENIKTNGPKMRTPKKDEEDKECEDYTTDNNYENNTESGLKTEIQMKNNEDKKDEDYVMEDNYENAEASGPNLELPMENEEEKGDGSYDMGSNYEN